MTTTVRTTPVDVPAPRSSGGPVVAPERRLPAMPGLDGLRAVAIVAVLLYHADVSWMPGGFLGVDLFFTLSGFLITALLLAEVRATGGLHLVAFYRRRARRLLPALWVLLLVVASAALIGYRDELGTLRRDIGGALVYVSNWLYVAGHESYFQASGRPPFLQHLWSLAVEEQFYLVWPVVLGLAARAGGPRRVRAVALGAAVLSALLMLVLSVRNGSPVPNDPSRVYYGTDTHATGLLVGAALATWWQPWRHPAGAVRRVPALDAVGVVALLLLVRTFVRVDEFDPAVYRGGLLLVAVVACALIVAVTHPRGRLGGALSVAPMRWLGTRSYGIYLWHWPIFMMTRPRIDVSFGGFGLLVLRLALTFAVAELSYRYVEQPCRRGALGRMVHRLRSGRESGRARWAVVAPPVILATTVAVVSGCVLTIHAPARPAEVTSIDASSPVPPPAVASSADPRPLTPSRPRDHRILTRTTPSSRRVGPGHVSAFGDSVMVGAAPALFRTLPDLTVDAAVGRQASVTITQIFVAKSRGLLGPRAVVHVGDNGILSAAQVETILDEFDQCTRVVVVNDFVPRRWQDPNNALLAQAVSRHPNAVLADWRALAGSHRGYLVGDGIHPTAAGMQAYAALVERRLTS